VVRVAAGLLVFAAVQRHPYSFYTLLRWICCPVFAYSAFAAHAKNRLLWTWIFGVLSLLYNPIFRVHLDRSTWTGVNWFTVGAIIIAATVFWKDKKSATTTSTNLAEAMTLEDAERIVQEYGSVLAAGGATDEIASYASRLPDSRERIIQAMKLWLAHEIKSRSLTEEFRNEIGTAASRLPFFIEDTEARRLNTLYRSNAPAQRAGLTTEETIRRANADREVFRWGTNATATGVLLRGELSNFTSVIEQFDPADSFCWQGVYTLAKFKHQPPRET
jgi:hypothetical protein